MQHWMTTACTVPWEVMSVMDMWSVNLTTGQGMALVLTLSQVRYAHFFLVLSFRNRKHVLCFYRVLVSIY